MIAQRTATTWIARFKWSAKGPATIHVRSVNSGRSIEVRTVVVRSLLHRKTIIVVIGWWSVFFGARQNAGERPSERIVWIITVRAKRGAVVWGRRGAGLLSVVGVELRQIARVTSFQAGLLSFNPITAHNRNLNALRQHTNQCGKNFRDCQAIDL